MNIGETKSIDSNINYVVGKVVQSVPERTAKEMQEDKASEQETEGKAPGNLERVTEELNQFMESLNTDIQFSLHEGTQSLMVQVVDIKKHKVLKEFPPHEFLDTIAKIREYVGILLDEKA